MKFSITVLICFFGLTSFGQDFSHVSHPEEEPLDFPVLKDSVYRMGVYENFLNFRNNAPSIEGPIEKTIVPRPAKNWAGTYEVIPRVVMPDGQREKVKKAWGFSDGKTLYVNWHGEFYPLEKQQNYFSFWGHLPINDTKAASQAVVVGVLGGAIGVTILRGVAGAQRFNSKEAYRIDMLTGLVSEADRYQAQTSGPFKILLYYWSPQMDNTEAVDIVLKNRKDSVANVLKANSYLAFPWTDLRSDIKVCVPGQADYCFGLLPKLKQTNYLEYIPASKKNPAASFKPVTEKEAEFYLKRIRYAQEIVRKRQAKQ